MAIDIIFHTDLKDKEDHLRKITVQKLTKLSARYDAILDATVTIVQDSPANTPHLIKSTVVLHAKPKNFVGTKTGEDAETILRQTFDAVERQIRKFFDQIKEPWEAPGEKISASGEET